MAGVAKRGRQHCVVHARTKKVLTRSGKRVCFPTAGKARAEANKTKCLIMGGKHCRV